MPEALVDIFERIRTEGGSVTVPVRPDPGDVRARARRIRARRRLAVAAGTACALGISIGIVSLARPGGTNAVVVAPASPTSQLVTGETVTPIATVDPGVPTTPYGPYKNLTPPGALLEVADVGNGQPGVRWTAMPTPQPDQVDSVGTFDCIGTDTSNDGIDGLGHMRSFRAGAPGGGLFVWQTVLRLDTAQTARTAQYLRDLAPCAKPRTREVVLSRSPGRLLTGIRRPGTGALVSASAWRLENDQLIVISVNGDPEGQIPIPGGLTWLTALTDRAVARAKD